MKKYLIFFLFLTGCSSIDQTADNPKFWDLARFFTSQQEKLSQSKATWQKQITIDEVVEEKEMNQINWVKELALFQESDLNKTVYQGNVKTVEQSDRTIYQITDPQLPIQRVFIQWDSNRLPKSIVIESAGDNLLYQTKKQLTAHFVDGNLVNYQIDIQQKVIGLDPSDVHVKVYKKGA